jgi:hypothetical protein
MATKQVDETAVAYEKPEVITFTEAELLATVNVRGAIGDSGGGDTEITL